MSDEKKDKNVNKKVVKKAPRTKKREEYLPKLKQLIESVGEWNINFSHLSREWDVPTSTLQSWRDIIFKEIGPIDVSKIGREICKGAEYNVKFLQKTMLKAEKVSQKINCIKAINDTSRALTEFLEAYKYKIKASEELSVSFKDDLSLSETEKLINFIENKD